MKAIIIVIVLIAAIFLSYRLVRKIRDKAEARNVIQFSLKHNRKKPAAKNMCSFCRKNAKRLSFYVNEGGKPIGVCDSCKVQAERRALPRL